MKSIRTPKKNCAQERQTPLLSALVNGHEEMAAVLLDAGADPQARCNQVCVPRSLALSRAPTTLKHCSTAAHPRASRQLTAGACQAGSDGGLPCSEAGLRGDAQRTARRQGRPEPARFHGGNPQKSV